MLDVSNFMTSKVKSSKIPNSDDKETRHTHHQRKLSYVFFLHLITLCYMAGALCSYKDLESRIFHTQQIRLSLIYRKKKMLERNEIKEKDNENNIIFFFDYQKKN